ncbi:radical SAM family heme chaperone HemW [Paenibacillus sp. FSL R7-0302]|uniref:radical SAM family heme chaperone HemW n=1 Tax=Paenibacillus sp. FSL R7-0302 TaxID=2921681 RepID=UPI0030F6F40F
MNNAKLYVEMFKERDSICVSHYPVPVSQHTEPEVRSLMELEQVNTKDTPVALYLHIPFCDATCSFCPFNRYLKRQDQVDRYLAAVRQEMDSYAATPFGSSVTVSSINLGGGTPSCLSSEELTGLLQYMKQSFRVEEEAMIFIEGNPRNFTADKLETLALQGLNRISVGVQTFQEELAEVLGLYHSVEDSFALVKNARNSGIENVGIDLMYNLPGQTLDQWRADILTSIEQEIDHICVISFCVVPHTQIASRIADGKIPGIGDVYREIELYTIAKEMLLEAGYEQYSVIDFAKPGKTDRHATLYFSEQAHMIGIGAAAFGIINGYMYINSGNLNEYMTRVQDGLLPVNCGEKADERELAHGAMAKGLRMLSVNRAGFVKMFGQEPEQLFPETIERLVQDGLLIQDAEGIRLTEDGIIWGNNVSKQFFSAKYADYGLQHRMKLAKGRPVQSVQSVQS